MQLLAYLNLSTGKLSSTLGGTSISLPQFIQGDSMRIGLRLSEQIEGSSFEAPRIVESIRASIGFIDLRPTSGNFVLRVGDGPYVASTNETDLIAHSAIPSVIKSALAEIGLPDAKVTSLEGSWLISNGGDPIELSGASASTPSTEMQPLSFVRIREIVRDGKYSYEVRLVQSPLASTSSFVPLVPPQPSVSRIQAGGEEATTVWPEIQALKINPTFRGTYQLRRGFKKTGELSVSDGPDEIAEALKLIADDLGTFTVTNPVENIAHITFEGAMAGIAQDLIEVEVFSAPEGDPTFTLNLNTIEVASALRLSDTIKPFLEIELTVQDENDPDVLLTYTSQRVPITLVRDLNWQGLEVAANIDWLRPPYGQSYVPFTMDQIITGTQNYTTPFGDASSFSFVITHNLATLSLLPPAIRDNSTGAYLVAGTDYRITAATTNTITVLTLDSDAWGLNALQIVVGAAGPTAAFQTHTHTIAQIDGLSIVLDDLGSRVEALEDLLPDSSPSIADSATTGPVASWKLPEMIRVFPTRTATTEKEVVSIDPEKLPRSGGLLPAVYTIAAPLTANTLPSSPVAGQIYQFNGSGFLTIPGYLGRKSSNLYPGGNYTWDGRGFYPVSKIVGFDNIAEIVMATAAGEITLAGNGTITVSGTNLTTTVVSFAVLLADTEFEWADKARTALAANSYLAERFFVTGDGYDFGLIEKVSLVRLSNVNIAYTNGTCTGMTPDATSERISASAAGSGDDVYYPTDFDMELFRIHVGEKQLRLGKGLALDFSLIAAVFRSNVSVQWGVVIDIGIPSKQGTISDNLLAVTFLPPSLDHTFILTEVPSAHSFGLRVIRKMVEAVDTLVVNKVLYGQSETTATEISSKNFVIRGRLARFDTANNMTDPRGLVAIQGFAATLDDTESVNTFGEATIN